MIDQEFKERFEALVIEIGRVVTGEDGRIPLE